MKHIISLRLSLTMVLLSVCTFSMATYDRGTCGPNANWAYIDGRLSITGTGPISDFSLSPFYRYGGDIKYINISEGITSIGKNTFHGCSSLISIEIPNSLTLIGDYAFSGCSDLSSIQIPYNVISLGISAFSGCESLTNINIPNSVTSIGEYAFEGCIGLESVHLSKEITTLKTGIFEYCQNLTKIELPNNITTIEKLAFYECSSLKCIEIPKATIAIGRNAFARCINLVAVSIPESLDSIGSDIFLYSENITTIHLKKRNPKNIKIDSFLALKNTATLIVPYDTKSLFANDSNWKCFTNIVEEPDYDFCVDDIFYKFTSLLDLNGENGAFPPTWSGSIHPLLSRKSA